MDTFRCIIIRLETWQFNIGNDRVLSEMVYEIGRREQVSPTTTGALVLFHALTDTTASVHAHVGSFVFLWC